MQTQANNYSSKPVNLIYLQKLRKQNSSKELISVRLCLQPQGTDVLLMFLNTSIIEWVLQVFQSAPVVPSQSAAH